MSIVIVYVRHELICGFCLPVEMSSCASQVSASFDQLKKVWEKFMVTVM